jgi:hypothetical protein
VEGDEGYGDEEIGKRAIGYQIQKNKGLTPHRKKELRNPRVKHRMKYRKAKIRRRGQVRWCIMHINRANNARLSIQYLILFIILFVRPSLSHFHLVLVKMLGMWQQGFH